MAVEQNRVELRYKAGFGSIGLPKTRLDIMMAKLAGKIKDDATDEEIDQEIKDLNEMYPFTEIKKHEDRLLNEKNNPNKKVEEKKEEAKVDPDEPAWFKAYREANDAKFVAMEQAKTKETIGSKFANDERVKNIPEFMRRGFVPTSNDDFESNVEALLAEYKPFAEKHKLQDMGNDNPASSTDTTAAGGKVKQISKAEAEKIADGL